MRSRSLSASDPGDGPVQPRVYDEPEAEQDAESSGDSQSDRYQSEESDKVRREYHALLTGT